MGRFFVYLAYWGILTLVIIIVLAVLAVTGVFEPEYANPPT